MSPNAEENIPKDSKPFLALRHLSRPYTLVQVLPIILAVACLCVSLGWILGRTWDYAPFFFRAPQGQSSTQQALMENVRSTILAATSQASQATEAVFVVNIEEINRIREFHDLITEGIYEQAWCLTTQENLPWGASYEEFVEFWSQHSARIVAPIVPLQGSIGWFYVTLMWETPPSSEEHFKYRLFPRANSKCSGWLIAEVVPVP